MCVCVCVYSVPDRIRHKVPEICRSAIQALLPCWPPCGPVTLAGYVRHREIERRKRADCRDMAVSHTQPCMDGWIDDNE